MRVANKKRMMFAGIVMCMLVTILATRLLALDHEMYFHMDEPHIYLSSDSLAAKVLKPSRTYEVSKVYPEGSFVMQAPFHLLSRLTGWYDGTETTQRLCGRFASVCFYMAGCAAGAFVLYRFFGRRIGSVVFFALLTVFSTFFQEQSRYATADPPSFFLIMMLTGFCCAYWERPRWRFVVWAGLTSGALAAAKYPQIYFLLLPLGVILFSRGGWKTSIWQIFTLLLCTLAGFLLFSPSLLVWPDYILQAVGRETTAYLSQITLGMVLDHLWDLLMYHLFYSDVPFAPLLALWGALQMTCRQNCVLPSHTHNSRNWFLAVFLPLVMLVFALYNLFVGIFTFRVLTPFFGVFLLYSANALNLLWKKRTTRMLVIALCGILVLRGTLLMGFLAAPDQTARAAEDMFRHTQWNSRHLTHTAGWVGANVPKPRQTYDIYQSVPEVGSHEFTLIGAMRYADMLQKKPRWETLRHFIETHAGEQIAQSYPDWLYYLFGYQLSPSSASLMEFPCTRAFYHP